jgi:hypothetical protein
MAEANGFAAATDAKEVLARLMKPTLIVLALCLLFSFIKNAARLSQVLTTK